jgi:hypothetical protein
VARIRAAGTPTPEDYQHALRDVVRRCIYGVDMNPLAVELCKVSLWMESIDPGLPLTFLESHVRHGNSLLGTTRDLMGDKVSEDAWVVLEGDDKKLTASIKKRNKAELAGQRLLLFGHANGTGALQEAIQAVEQAPDTDVATLAEKEQRWKALLASQAYEHSKLVADAWCAAFLWPKDKPGPVADAAPTTAVWRSLRDKEASPSPVLVETTRKIAEQYAVFHWELAFPQVFGRGGFDVVLGNPPWERVKLQEQEFFAEREPSIAKAQNASERKKLIAALPTTNPGLWGEWCLASRVAQGQSHFSRQSARYPLCGKGDVNTYALFAEHNWRITGPHGRAGFIVPSGIATDDTTKEYFQTITRSRALQRMWEFENEGFFTAGKGHMLRFALTTLSGRDDPADAADFLFQGQAVSDIDDPERHFTLTADDIATINPNTGTCPIFRRKRDASITLPIYRRVGILWREDDPDGNPWGLRYMRMFDLTNDAALFRTRGDLVSAGWKPVGSTFEQDGDVFLPLYEAKMATMFNHRCGSFEAAGPNDRPHRLPRQSDEQLADPGYIPQPHYWVREKEVRLKIDGIWDRQWFLGWRRVADARASVRTIVPSLIPYSGVSYTICLMFPSSDVRRTSCLYANMASIALDYLARQKVGGLSVAFGAMNQIAFLPPNSHSAQCAWDSTSTVDDWVLPRILELTYTAWDLRPFAEDCGESGPPFIWDPARRFQLQCELDAAFFHLYGISRDDTAYILDTFDVLQRADEREHGEFRTKRVILEICDALAEAVTTGKPYVSPLGPPRRAT